MSKNTDEILGAAASEETLAERLESNLWWAVQDGINANFTRWRKFTGAPEGEWFELQALKVPDRYGQRTRFAHASDVETACALLEEAEAFGGPGLYTVANQINPAVATRRNPG